MIEVPGKTPEEVQESILRIARKVAPNFKFGYHSNSDMIQQACIFACEALASGKYDASRPLDNFLYTHMVNRLINYRRDKYRRTDSPCKLCYGYENGFSQHDDGKHCQKYIIWHKRNVSKQNIILPLDITIINYDKESNVIVKSSVLDTAVERESLELVNYKLPIELRATYLQMREGIKVPKAKRDEVERAILNIIGE